MKRLALCLAMSLCVISGPAAADKKVPATATCEKSCSGTNKGCAISCFHATGCINACTAAYKACSAGCKK